jgi:hypothetical protein
MLLGKWFAVESRPDLFKSASVRTSEFIDPTNRLQLAQLIRFSSESNRDFQAGLGWVCVLVSRLYKHVYYTRLFAIYCFQAETEGTRNGTVQHTNMHNMAVHAGTECSLGSLLLNFII